MFDAIDKLKKKLKNAEFYRIFYEQSETESLGAKDGKIESIATDHNEGISVFYVRKGFSYFYATNDSKNIDKFEMLNNNRLPKNIDYRLTESWVKDKKVIGKPAKHQASEFVKDISSATKLDKKIVTNVGRYSYAKKKRIIVCPNTEIEQTKYIGTLGFSATAKDGNKVRDDYVRHGISTAVDDVSEMINKNVEMRKEVEKKLQYKEGISGSYDIIIDPDLSDLLAHEAIGHATESDLIGENFSILKGKLEKTLAPKFVTLLDDPTPKDDLFGAFYYDDEGFPAKRKELIKKGILNEYIVSSKYSSKLDLKNNGGARAESYSFLPIPRMSNTSFESGKSNLDEMISEMKEGVILSKGSGGQVDPNSGVFQFGVREGRLVKNGEIVSNHVNLTFGGNILDALKNIVEVSKQVNKDNPGFCGKEGQHVPVGGFGPYLKIKSVKLG